MLLILEIFLTGAKSLFDFHCGGDSAVCHWCFPVLLSSVLYVLYWFSSSLLFSYLPRFLVIFSNYLVLLLSVMHDAMFLMFSRRAELATFVWPICFRP